MAVLSPLVCKCTRTTWTNTSIVVEQIFYWILINKNYMPIVSNIFIKEYNTVNFENKSTIILKNKIKTQNHSI